MMQLNDHIFPDDKAPVRQLLEKSGFFYPFEAEIVMELMDETILKGSPAAGYYWLTLKEDKQLLGFVTYGPNPSSVHSWDVYWLAVDASRKNRGLGTKLLLHTEEKIREMGGKIVWIETSGRSLYEPTVAFYLRKGYSLKATLPEFYGPGDAKLIFCKSL